MYVFLNDCKLSDYLNKNYNKNPLIITSSTKFCPANQLTNKTAVKLLCSLYCHTFQDQSAPYDSLICAPDNPGQKSSYNNSSVKHLVLLVSEYLI